MAEKSDPVAAILQQQNERIIRGDMDSLIHVRHRHLDVITRNARNTTPDIEFQARARCAQIYLLMVDRPGAHHCLAPLLKRIEAAPNPEDPALLKLLSGTTQRTRGLVYAQVGNLLYSLRNYDAGHLFAREADGLLHCPDEASNPQLLFLDRWENTAWWARLLWLRERHDDAEQKLKKVTDALTFSAPSSIPSEGVDQIMALVLDISGSFDWRRGMVASARYKIYRALFLLSGAVRNSVLKAHALHLAGRIEATVAEPTSNTAWRLLGDAQSLFAQVEHPYRFRTMTKQAQSLIRANRLEEAGERLLALEQALGKSVKGFDEVERGYVEAEATLARLWILKRHALLNEDWTDYVSLAGKLAVSDSLPLRLRAEKLLHHGYGLTKQVEKSSRERGLRYLDEARRLARRILHKKIEAASHLGTTEALLDWPGHESEARGHWRAGLALLAQVDSRYLEEWRKRVVSRIEGTGEATIPLDQPLLAARELLDKRYFEYLLTKRLTKKELFDRAGLKPSTGFRILRKLKLDH